MSYRKRHKVLEKRCLIKDKDIIQSKLRRNVQKGSKTCAAADKDYLSEEQLQNRAGIFRHDGQSEFLPIPYFLMNAAG